MLHSLSCMTITEEFYSNIDQRMLNGYLLIGRFLVEE